ncbi:MAG: hypothetical protein V1745_00195 [Patescibacteria group bacterium]
MTCTREPQQDVVGFLDRQLAEHFADRFAPTLSFMPDPENPELYGVVNKILRERMDEDGTFTIHVDGVARKLRVQVEHLGLHVTLVRTPSFWPPPPGMVSATL